MRVGERGSVSPVGDMLAFAISLTIVGVLALMLFPGTEEAGRSGEITGEDLLFISRSSLFDPDGDGRIETVGGVESVNGTGYRSQLPFGGKLLISIVWEKGEMTILFVDGLPMGPERSPESELLVHGISVLLEVNETVCPGLLRGGYL